MRHIRTEDINKELRLIGAMVRTVMPHFTEKSFRKQNKILQRFLKGRWFGKNTSVNEEFIAREDGTKLRILVCKSKNGVSKKATGLLWMHGGGYAMGLPEQDFVFADLFSADGNCVTVLPDYARSVDAPYPAALHDCYQALLYMKNNADELGIDVNQIFVGGESSGGGLAAALTLYARDKKKVAIAFQIPLYPMIDDKMFTGSMQNNDAPVWNIKSNIAGWKLYLQSLDDESPVPAYAAPSRAADLSNLPPFCTYVGTIDPFHDETIIYADKLKEHGVDVSLKTFEGCFHAFDLIGFSTQAAKEARAFLLEEFRYAQKTHYAKNDSLSEVNKRLEQE